MMNLFVVVEDVEFCMLGVGEFGYLNDYLKKNMIMNFVLMYNGENKILLFIKIWVINLFILFGSMNILNVFKSLKLLKRIRKFYFFIKLLILWNL